MPTFVQERETAYSTASPKTTATFDTSAGDVLVAIVAGADQGDAATISNNGAATTWVQEQVVSVGSYCWLSVWTTTPGARTGMTVTFTRSGGSNFFGGNVLTIGSTAGVDSSDTKTNVASGAPSLAITPTVANCMVIAFNADWTAADGASRTWRTINSITPTLANGREKTYFRDAAQYTVYGAYWEDVGTAAAKTTGLSAPGSQKYSIIAVALKPSTGTSDAATPGVAAGTGVAPTPRFAASAGVASTTAPTAGASTSASQGGGTAAGVSPVAVTTVATILGIAAGAGVVPSSSTTLAVPGGVASATGVAPITAAATPLGLAAGSGTGPAPAVAAGVGAAISAGAPVRANVEVTLGIVAASGPSPSSSSVVAVQLGAAACSAVAPDSLTMPAVTASTAVGVGVVADAVVNAPAGVGAANANGVMPGTGTPAVAGIASTVGGALGAVVQAGAAVSVATSLAASSTTTTTTTPGVVVGLGVSPTDGSLDTTPIRGIASGLGITPGATAIVAVTMGAATCSGMAPIHRTILTAGMATGVATSPSATVTSTAGAAVGQGGLPSASATVEMTVITASGVELTEVVLKGVATGVGITPGSTLYKTATAGAAVTFGIAASDRMVVLVARAPHRGSLYALEQLPGGIAHEGISTSGVVVHGIELVGT